MVVVVTFIQFSCIASLLSSPTINVRADRCFVLKIELISAIFYSWVIKVRYSVQRNLEGFIGPILLYVGAFLYMYQDSETCRIPTVRLLIFPKCSVCHGPYSHSAVCDISPVSSPASSRPGQWHQQLTLPSSVELSGAQWSSPGAQLRSSARYILA